MKTNNTYAAAGVRIDVGDEAVRQIAPLAAATHAGLRAQGAALLGGIGGFASVVRLPAGLKKPVLVSATDGVGTKLELAREYDKPECVGADVVAMCVNDLLCAGVQPLYFLDYFACGKLQPNFVAAVVRGIADACCESGCALVGGETAEMPGTYADDKFDVAGFAVGVGEEDDLFSPRHITAADALVAVASDGAHSNGYSLIRRILQDNPTLKKECVDGVPLIDALLTPTRLYCRSVAALRAGVTVRGLAHITGGGVVENLPRILPSGIVADVAAIAAAAPLPPLFALLQDAGGVEEAEMRRVFNCGIGMIAVVPVAEADAAVQVLNDNGERAWKLGGLKRA